MMFSFTLLSLLASVSSAPMHAARSTPGTYSITIVNNCTEKVWPAGWQTNTARGILDSKYKGTELDAGKSWVVQAPNDAYGLQFWARQGCTGTKEAGNFHCTVGDCSGYQCTDLNWTGGAILAELGSGQDTTQYNTDITSYDLSAIGGNNVGMKIVPSISSCLSKLCPQSGCAADQAWTNANQAALGSPADTTCSNTADFTITFCPN